MIGKMKEKDLIQNHMNKNVDPARVFRVRHTPILTISKHLRIVG